MVGADLGETLLILNFASRLLTAVSDRDMVTDMALETLADFAEAPRVALWNLSSDGERLTLDRVFSGNASTRPELTVAVPGSAFERVFAEKRDLGFVPGPEAPAPLPGAEPGSGCLVLPVVASSGLILGALSVESQAEAPETLASLRLLTTVLAVSLDNARLFELAMVDGLTGLFMRRYYDARILEEISACRADAPMCLVMFDIDHFKRVNDTWGHATGDLVLREFAREVRDGVRRGHDVACRYGGEEFALIMPRTTAEEALRVVEGVRDAARALAFPGIEPRLKITVSAGIAQADGPAATPEVLFSRADKALYEAKETGRDKAIIAK